MIGEKNKQHTIDFSEEELQVILKALKVSRFYFDDNTRTERQDEIETLLISVLEEDYKIHTFNHSV